jgi:hypothetical protein
VDTSALSQDDLEAILHAPFRVFSLVASADRPADEAQFRRLGEELLAARSVFVEGTIGRTMIEAVSSNLEVLWTAYQAADTSPKSGLKRAMKALQRVPEAEGIAVRDWLIGLGVGIAQARHTIGERVISDAEHGAIRDLARWLDRPVP